MKALLISVFPGHLPILCWTMPWWQRFNTTNWNQLCYESKYSFKLEKPGVHQTQESNVRSNKSFVQARKVPKRKRITSVGSPSSALRTRHTVTRQEPVMLKEGKWLWAKSPEFLASPCTAEAYSYPCFSLNTLPPLPSSGRDRTAWSLLCLGNGVTPHRVPSCSTLLCRCFSASWPCPLPLHTSCTTGNDKSQVRTDSLMLVSGQDAPGVKKSFVFLNEVQLWQMQRITSKHVRASSS